MISKLPKLMASKGIDQKTLAYQTGLSPTTVSKVYRAQFNQIDNHTFTTLCLYFGLKSLSELIDIEWEKDDIEGTK
ncbi:MAG: helix-turn-helix transcriptional regulator [Xenococcaceae cyanobacterium MO_207.B15]|nr:helix-turn-helix transcriptional regulator [Xenococcaceae cyanobacterium MO_207.B15]